MDEANRGAGGSQLGVRGRRFPGKASRGVVSSPIQGSPVLSSTEQLVQQQDDVEEGEAGASWCSRRVVAEGGT